ncbi:MAG: hypothetical protein WC959_03975 [Kiritimatiellales bacterium]
MLCKETAAFRWAKPVWPAGLNTEMNLMAGFRAVFTAPAQTPVVLRQAAYSFYRLRVNGEFVGCGPARGPLGEHRVDQYDLSAWLRPGRNVVSIEVSGYNINGNSIIDQPSFLQAEIAAENELLAATGRRGAQAFAATVIKERKQKVQRYSYMRAFIEEYAFSPGWNSWMSLPEAPFAEVELDEFPEFHWLPRHVPYFDFYTTPAKRLHSKGRFIQNVCRESLWKDRSLTGIGPNYKGFSESELDSVLSTEMQQTEIVATESTGQAVPPESRFTLAAGEFLQFDFGRNLTGFPFFTFTCRETARIFLVFDETLIDSAIQFNRGGCVNVISYTLAPGVYTLESFEPYTMRYVKLMVLQGAGAVGNICIRSFENTDTRRAVFQASDKRLEQLFEAGRNTFAQNATDVFMDCPSRERAAYLCDSFFTARSALALSGDTRVEKVFFENYSRPEHFRYMPAGMLPMSYPGDHYPRAEQDRYGRFIPNWAMWFVIELREYFLRSGDAPLIDELKPKVFSLLDYFTPFENADGLLEKLDGWVFVEWSMANKFTQDVNYPSNMLYAGMLDAVAELYNLPEFSGKAELIRETIRQQSFDGEFFVDNAVRNENGVLEVSRNRTEVCQYFAFFFGVATRQSHPELWARLRDQFGPDRAQAGAFNEVHPANAFIGNMLRLELLSDAGLSRQILNEAVEYLMYMAERTGTLWEMVDDKASLCHGFASHITVILLRDILGVYKIDPVRKMVSLRFVDTGLEWCRASIPVGDATVVLQWTLENGQIIYEADLPAGFSIEMLPHEMSLPAVQKCAGSEN